MRKWLKKMSETTVRGAAGGADISWGFFGTYGAATPGSPAPHPTPRRLRNETLSHLRSTSCHGGAEIVKRTRRAVPTVHTLASRGTARVQAPSQSPPTVGGDKWAAHRTTGGWSK